MLGLDQKTAQVTWTVLVILLAVELAWLARGAILILVIALLLAYLISPAVEFAQRWLPKRWPRGAVVALLFSTIVAAAGLVLFFVFSRIVQEAAELAARLPALLKDGGTLLEAPLPPLLEPYREEIREFVTTHALGLVPTLGKIGTGLVSHLGHVLYIILVPILSFLFLLEAERVRETIAGLFPQQRLLVGGVVEDVHRLLGAYMRAVFTLALATFISYTVYFEITGVPYALLLAGAAGVLEFIPVVGPLAGMVLGVGVALFSGYSYWGWMIIFFLVYRLFQDYVLQPKLMSAGIELHPILVLFGVLAGEMIAGIPGLLLSVPLMALFPIIYRHLR